MYTAGVKVLAGDGTTEDWGSGPWELRLILYGIYSNTELRRRGNLCIIGDREDGITLPATAPWQQNNIRDAVPYKYKCTEAAL